MTKEPERTPELARGEQAARQLVAWAQDTAHSDRPVEEALAVIAAARDYLSRYLDSVERSP